MPLLGPKRRERRVRDSKIGREKIHALMTFLHCWRSSEISLISASGLIKIEFMRVRLCVWFRNKIFNITVAMMRLGTVQAANDSKVIATRATSQREQYLSFTIIIFTFICQSKWLEHGLNINCCSCYAVLMSTYGVVQSIILHRRKTRLVNYRIIITGKNLVWKSSFPTAFASNFRPNIRNKRAKKCCAYFCLLTVSRQLTPRSSTHWERELGHTRKRRQSASFDRFFSLSQIKVDSFL